jgi:hypothetical protein
MRRLLWGGLLITATIAMSSCGSGQDEAVAPAVSASSSDLDTAARLYTGMTRTPADFLADPAPMSFAQVTTYHLKSRQLDAAATASHELCTDDWSEALAWSEAFAQQAPQYLDLVGNLETERYYEFDRVPRGVLDQYVRMRVYRCDYLDRDNVNLGSAAARCFRTCGAQRISLAFHGVQQRRAHRAGERSACRGERFGARHYAGEPRAGRERWGLRSRGGARLAA